MQCPGCSAEMDRLALDAVLGGTVEIDLCSACRAFWFEPYETLHLTPASTLQLFRLIADAMRAGGAAPDLVRSRCPKCRSVLILTHDRQRNTPFQYWRCDQGHGRFTRFTEFLKEKNFIQPLSPQQVAELRAKIRMINCSNCGAPVDLVKDSGCRHCGSPLIMLDMEKMARVASDYQRAAGAKPLKLPALPRESMLDSPSRNLLEINLADIADWLIDLLRINR